MNEEYVSITEFAKKAGVSRQTIYNRLDNDLSNELSNDLSNFCKVVNGKKVINTKALALFGVKKSVKESVKESVKDFTDVDTLKSMIEVLQRQSEMLQQQLDVKDKQIAELNERLKENSQSLRAITHKDLADSMLLQEKATEEPLPKKHWWRRNKKS